jgi:ATP/maltotriose-dependent transcriptional regulator MalT
MRLTEAGVSLLGALDHGAYRDAIARYESSEPTGDAVDTIWRAEVAVYLGRLDDARVELDRLPATTDRDLANRVQILRAEIAFWDKRLDEARDLVAPVIQSTWEVGDHQGHLRSTLLRARTELRRGNSAEALERLKEPRRLATVLGNDFYAGIIAHCRAFALYNLGDYKSAGHAFAEALRLLKSSEGLRWEMTCRTLHAGFLAEIGRYEDSLSELDHCEQVALGTTRRRRCSRWVVTKRSSTASVTCSSGSARRATSTRRSSDSRRWRRRSASLDGSRRHSVSRRRPSSLRRSRTTRRSRSRRASSAVGRRFAPERPRRWPSSVG